MQYHLNGFRPGDPTLHPAATRETGGDTVDVLIVGCGPAGLTLAAQLCAFPEISVRIVERKPGPIDKGQADGISCRSMEMFQAFGFADTIKAQGYSVNEATFWKPDPAAPGRIIRTGRVQDVQDDLSDMPHMILNQARVHDMYLDIMRKSPRRLEPDYSTGFAGLEIDETQDYPVRVTLDHLDGDRVTGQSGLRARYVVGCDGARSSVRQAIGRTLSGDSANQAWGVMDVLAVTDFPDIRFKSLIHSQAEGNILVIPREGGYLVRLYVELDKLDPGERVANRKITVDHLIAAAGRILTPYEIDVKEVVWWSVYEIGQRLTDKFDDVPEGGGDRTPHVFIAGDACHTHSPKAGQGMNVSMGDAFNLGWKLAHVLRGQAGPDLLHSYSAERQKVAQDLIDFDREWAKIMSERSADADADAGETPVFQKYFVEHGRYTAGLSVRYGPSALTGGAGSQGLAAGLPIGERFHSAPVIRLGDAHPMQLGHCVEADGRWRVFAFAPDAKSLKPLCDFISDDPQSPWVRFRARGADIDALIDLRAVLPSSARDMDLAILPALLRPAKGRYGLIDYEKVFVADPRADIFAMRGIDAANGCLVIVRPDQYVAHVLPRDATEDLTAFFDGIFRPAT